MAERRSIWPYVLLASFILVSAKSSFEAFSKFIEKVGDAAFDNVMEAIKKIRDSLKPSAILEAMVESFKKPPREVDIIFNLFSDYLEIEIDDKVISKLKLPETDIPYISVEYGEGRTTEFTDFIIDYPKVLASPEGKIMENIANFMDMGRWWFGVGISGKDFQIEQAWDKYPINIDIKCYGKTNINALFALVWQFKNIAAKRVIQNCGADVIDLTGKMRWKNVAYSFGAPHIPV